MNFKLLMRVAFSCTLIFCVINSTVPAFGQEILFQFNPPENITFYQNLKVSKTNDMGSLGSRTDVSNSRTKIEINKIQDGYTFTATALSAKMYRNGEEVANPILALLQNIIVVYEIDYSGKITAVHGYDKLADLMKESLPRQVVEQLEPILNEKTLVNKDIFEWNGRVASFVGNSVEIGDVFASTEQFELPMGGTATYYSITEISKVIKCNEHECIEITFHYNSNPEDLAKSVGNVINDIFSALNISKKDFQLSNISIVGDGQRIIDPSTMLIYSEKIERTMEMELDIPDQGKVPTKQLEKREYTFEY